ncbi:hypothetical protein D3C76_376580 [compost metagenome]
MEKKTYYVSVQGRSLLDNEDEASYEWVIHATKSEADTICHMLEQIGETEDSEFLAYTYPWPDTPEDGVNANYSSLMNDLYHEIYRLGSEETRQQVKVILERS